MEQVEKGQVKSLIKALELVLPEVKGEDAW